MLGDKFPKITGEEVETFMESRKDSPRRTKEIKGVLEYLNRNVDFREAVESGIGKELLGEATTRVRELHNKMIEAPLERKERVEFDFLLKLIEGWARRINVYLKTVKKIKGNE